MASPSLPQKNQPNYLEPVLELICMVCFFQFFSSTIINSKKQPMSPTFLFQKNTIPINYQILDNTSKDKQLLAVKSNSEKYQIVHLLFGTMKNNSPLLNQSKPYLLYNWNTTSNKLTFNFQSSSWNCTVKCQITASQTFFLLEDRYSSFLYLLDPNTLIDSEVTVKVKNKIPILNETQKIRKKSDINKNHYVYASGLDVLVITYTNNKIITNLFPIPSMYNFNPNNFVLDTKLYLNQLYILYRSIATYNIYLYQFNSIQNLYEFYPKNTKLNETGIAISEVFRFNNNYVTKVIRFVRGMDKSTTKFIIWAYNDNQAYKCPVLPCIGFGYQIYQNIVFSKVSSANRLLGFYGKSNTIQLKTFSNSLISEKVGQYCFDSTIYETQMISYSSSTINRLTIALSNELFPKVYQIVDNCRIFMASQQKNFCKCSSPYYYNSTVGLCQTDTIENGYLLSSLYIAFITITTILLLALIFIIYRKIISIQKIRKSWKYNAAENIIFQ